MRSPAAYIEDCRAESSKRERGVDPQMSDETHLPKALRDLLDDPRVTVRETQPSDGLPKWDGKCVVYWMQRAERGADNAAVDVAVHAANELGLPLVVYFAGIANFPSANLRHYAFLNQGLPDIEADLAERNISFVMRRFPNESHEQLFADVDAALVIGDENPMRGPESWRQALASRLEVPFWTVDADVIVPSKLLEKEQYGAYIIRPRLYKRMPDFVHPFQNPHARHAWKRPPNFKSDSVHEDITRGWPDLDRSVLPVEDWKGGAHEAVKRLRHFVAHILPAYGETRNKPEMDGTSRMSPYLHFGHIGPMTIVLAVEAALKKDPALQAARDGFINELVAWRELAVNFVKYNPNYDNPACAENWAQASIAEHARDEREHLYTREQLERGETYDDLWNASQTQMVRFGWMHNYMRMYWAKKILEWTPDIATAMKHAIYLDDKYFLDGRDPNGYAGIAWSMVGKFDRPWFDRPIFGKVRYMSGGSTGKKFNSKKYIEQMREIESNRDPAKLF